VKLPTVLQITEFLTLPFTLASLTNCMELIIVSISHNCGYKTSHRIVIAGVNICMIRLLYIDHLYTTPSTESLKIPSTSTIGPSGSTKVGAALLF
jgi:hypothetical protein